MVRIYGLKKVVCMELTINPWNEEEKLKKIPVLEEYSEDKVLYNLAKILDEWPGVSTPILSKKERHERFIMAIAGYPEIEIGTKPLDWTLHEKSIRAFETSIYLDSINGILEKSSLRSELLNVDLNMRTKIKIEYPDKHAENVTGEEIKEMELKLKYDQKYGEKWENITTECLSILFKILNSKNKYDDAQEALLASIFSYDNKNGIIKGWKRTYEKLRKFEEMEEKGYSFPLKDEEPKDPCLDRDIIKILMKSADDKLDKDQINLKNDYEKFSKFKKYKKPLYELVKINEDKWLYEINFQFYRIQTWMNDLIKYNKSDGTPQRILRGASLILETMISEMRNLCMESFGPGSIIIDGGGRLRILVSKENEAQKLVKEMNTRFEEFLKIRPIWGPTQGQKRLEVELERWFRSENVDGKYEEIGKNKNNMGKQVEIISPMIKKLAESGLPPRKINYKKRMGNKDKKINNNKQLINALNDWKEPPTIKQNKDDKICPFSNEEISKKLELEKKWGAVDKWCFEWNREKNKEFEVNQNHKFLYIIGHYQRIKDSVLHRPKIVQRKKMKNEYQNLYEHLNGKDRAVVGLLKLDGNSVGHIFNPKNEHLNDEIIRRRSFRFNAIWWCSIYYAINENGFNGGDQLGAWVVAGDDVLIAEYKYNNNQNSTFLEQLMKNLSKNINSTINEELKNKQKNPILTFSAGYTKKQKNDRINSMLKRVERNEKYAKEIWKKTIIDDEKEHMMSEEKIKTFKATKNISSESNSIKFHKICELDYSDNDLNENLDYYYEDNDDDIENEEMMDEKGKMVEIDWPEKWDEQKLKDLLTKLEPLLTEKMNKLIKSDYSKLFGIITRSEKDLDSNKTIILIKNH